MLLKAMVLDFSKRCCLEKNQGRKKEKGRDQNSAASGLGTAQVWGTHAFLPPASDQLDSFRDLQCLMLVELGVDYHGLRTEIETEGKDKISLRHKKILCTLYVYIPSMYEPTANPSRLDIPS